MARNFTYTANLYKAQSARQWEEQRSKQKPRRQRFFDTYLLDTKEYYSLSKP